MIDPDLMQELLAFRRDRDWEQFHTPKNLAIAIAVEAGELLEQFQWQQGDGARVSEKASSALRHEMADVAILLSYLAHDLKVDLDEAVREKLRLNGERYPVSQSKGTAEKYTERVPSAKRAILPAPSLGLPEGLRQVLEVVQLARTTKRDRVEAVSEVARRHHVEPPTVADACTRRLKLNVAGFDLLIAEPRLSGLERLLRSRYPGHDAAIRQFIGRLRR